MKSDGNERLRIAADLFVLVILCFFAVLLRPRTDYLSFKLFGNSPFSKQALGGMITVMAMAMIAGYLALSLRGRRAAGTKLLIVVLFSVGFVVLPTVSDMLARKELGIRTPGKIVSFPHDGGVLQTEAAMAFLVGGRNPYKADYRATEMAQSHHSNPRLWKRLGFDENPALDFFPYPPMTLLLSMPVALAWEGLFGWYDQRVVYIIALIALGLVGYRLAGRSAFRLPLLCLLVLNPFYAQFFTYGFNDILCVLFVVATVLALKRHRMLSAAVWLGLACGLKQFAWLLVPFYLAILTAQEADGSPGKKLSAVAGKAWPLPVVAGCILLPFFAWDPAAFIHSLVTAQGSVYPLRPQGFGLSSLLLLAGWLDGPRSGYPSLLFYTVAVLPVAAYGVVRTMADKTISAMLTWYTLTLFLFMFFSRFFAPNYVWLPLVTASLALMLREEEMLSCKD